MTQRLCSRDTALALPNVKITSPRRTSSRLASRTSARSDSSTFSSSGLSGDAAQFGQHIAGFHAGRIALSEREVKLAVEAEQLPAAGRLHGLGLDGAESGAQLILSGFDGGEGAARHEGEDGRAEAGDISFWRQDGFARYVGV